MKKRGTKVTAKNMYSVMGKINAFLSAPTVMCDIGEDVVLNATCSENAYRLRLREKEELTDVDEFFIKDALLAIYDEGAYRSLPIERDSYVFITGNHMFIYRSGIIHWREEDGSISTRRPKKTEVILFRHVIPDNAYQNRLLTSNVKAVLNNTFDGIYYTDPDEAGLYIDEFRSITRTLQEEAYEMLNDIDATQDVLEKTVSIDLGLGDTAEFMLRLDLTKNRIRPCIGTESFSICYGEECFDDVVTAALEAIRCIFADDEFDENEEEYETE